MVKRNKRISRNEDDFFNSLTKEEIEILTKESLLLEKRFKKKRRLKKLKVKHKDKIFDAALVSQVRMNTIVNLSNKEFIDQLIDFIDNKLADEDLSPEIKDFYTTQKMLYDMIFNLNKIPWKTEDKGLDSISVNDLSVILKDAIIKVGQIVTEDTDKDTK